VTKRLLLREQLRIRRVTTTQRQLFEDTLKKERVEVDDPGQTGMVHEQFAADEGGADRRHDGLVDRFRRALH
jgi:stress response protein YsnF